MSLQSSMNLWKGGHEPETPTTHYWWFPISLLVLFDPVSCYAPSWLLCPLAIAKPFLPLLWFTVIACRGLARWFRDENEQGHICNSLPPSLSPPLPPSFASDKSAFVSSADYGAFVQTPHCRACCSQGLPSALNKNLNKTDPYIAKAKDRWLLDNTWALKDAKLRNLHIKKEQATFLPR